MVGGGARGLVSEAGRRGARSLNPTLARLPAGLGRLPRLREVDLRACTRLRALPRAVIDAGAAATADYLGELCGEGVQPNRQVMLVVMGDGEVGKTSFMHAFRSPDRRAQRIPADHRSGDTPRPRSHPCTHL